VLTDVDDTLTDGPRLPGAAYMAIERLQGAGITVIPVTAAPAGWCDLMARMWPVGAVIGDAAISANGSEPLPVEVEAATNGAGIAEVASASSPHPAASPPTSPAGGEVKAAPRPRPAASPPTSPAGGEAKAAPRPRPAAAPPKPASTEAQGGSDS